MDVGSFTSGLLTGLREGVEAALIVSIILAYLARTGHRDQFGRIWMGTASAIGISFLAGIGLFLTVGGLQPPYEQLFEAIAMLLACAVVTWMLFWMRRQSAAIKGELHAALEKVLTAGGVIGLATLAFTAVIREGLETSLFLVAQATSSVAGAASVLVGALVGLGIAALLGVGFYRGSRRINLGSFFRWTGIGLIFIAAGLLSAAMTELVEIGWVGIGTGTAFDISTVLPHEAMLGAPTGLPLIVGELLRALLGYNSQPSFLALGMWAGYILVVLALYLRPMPPRPAAAVAPAPSTTAG